MADQKIEFIINNLQENQEVEAKNWLNGLNSNDDKANLAKEIIALGNYGGGYIFIGFEDEGTEFRELTPRTGEFEAFTQDAVAGVVERYVMPPCQCRIETQRLKDGAIDHPVIIVPGKHRTPLWAKRGSSNGQTLQSGKVYIRRPGGNSEVARTQDDWEKLIDRLVKARQSEMLSSIREILNPSSLVITKEESSLEDWDQASYDLWKGIVSNFNVSDPRRLETGHWTVSFSISPIEIPSLNALNTVIDREMPKHSGWPPFTYLHRDPVQPVAQGDFIQAYIGHARDDEAPEQRTEHADYWRLSKHGKGFMLRPMQEDRAGFMSHVTPAPMGPYYEWTLPIYRLTEILKYIEALAARLGEDGSTFQLLLKYYGMRGRTLQQQQSRYILHDGAECHIDNLESRIEASVSSIRLGVEELVYSILAPIYEQFDFTELPRQLVNNVVTDVLGFNR